MPLEPYWFPYRHVRIASSYHNSKMLFSKRPYKKVLALGLILKLEMCCWERQRMFSIGYKQTTRCGGSCSLTKDLLTKPRKKEVLRWSGQT